jgi:hypothetical protein
MSNRAMIVGAYANSLGLFTAPSVGDLERERPRLDMPPAGSGQAPVSTRVTSQGQRWRPAPGGLR